MDVAQHQQYAPGGRIPAQLYPQSSGNMRPPAYPQGYGQVKAQPRRLNLPGRWTPGSLVFAICIIVLAVMAIIVSFELINDMIEEQYQSLGEKASQKFENTTSILKLAIVALIPLLLIIALVRWIDRWEPEPILFYVLSLGWGAGVSVYLAFKGNKWWGNEMKKWLIENRQLSFRDGGIPNIKGDGGPLLLDILQTAVGAGVVEEGVKGLGILLMFIFLKKYINGPIDGMIYGTLIGAGFAFTENILYFAKADVKNTFIKQAGIDMSQDVLEQTIVIRAVASPFVHPICTAITGLLIGLAATQRLSWLFVLPLGLAGYAMAAGLHASHNFSAIIRIAEDTWTRILIQIPVYISAIAMIIVVKNLQRTTVKRGIRLLVADGFIGKEDETMLMKSSLRSRAVAWAGERLAASGGVAQDGRKAMRRYQSELLQAGFFRALLADNEKSPDLAVIKRERERMSFILKLRSVFLPSTTSKPNAAPASAPAPVQAAPAPVHATPAHPQAVSAARSRSASAGQSQSPPAGRPAPTPGRPQAPSPGRPQRRQPASVPQASPGRMQPPRHGQPQAQPGGQFQPRGQSQRRGQFQPGGQSQRRGQSPHQSQSRNGHDGHNGQPRSDGQPRPQGHPQQSSQPAGSGGYRPSQQSDADYPPAAPPPQGRPRFRPGGGRTP